MTIQSKLPARSIFKSKTAFANSLLVLAGALGSISPDAKQTISDNANAILLVSGIIGFALRYVTKGHVTLFGD